MSAVLAANVTNSTDPSPNAAAAARATIDWPPALVGRRPYWTANSVSPMNRMPSRIDIAVIVFAAFFASGGLNAGHAVGDGLDAGQRDRPAGERLEQEQDRRSARAPRTGRRPAGGTWTTVPGRRC